MTAGERVCVRMIVCWQDVKWGRLINTVIRKGHCTVSSQSVILLQLRAEIAGTS